MVISNIISQRTQIVSVTGNKGGGLIGYGVDSEISLINCKVLFCNVSANDVYSGGLIAHSMGSNLLLISSSLVQNSIITSQKRSGGLIGFYLLLFFGE